MSVQKCLVGYAVGVSLALAFVVLLGASRPAAPEEITVRRINLLEPDGTIRLVISGAQEAPGLYFHNKEHPHSSGGRPAGMYFMNDEGTELGGIIFSGNKKEDGRPFSLVQFSMDNYDQDQALVLRHIQDQGIETAFMVNDVPLVPKDPALLAPLATLEGEERQKLLEDLRATGMFDSRMRMFAGRTRDGDALLSLHDAEGRPRLYFRVTEEGTVGIKVLDEKGETVKDLTK
ncbi:MAG: hypothetical protein JSU87_08930 [Gemmatimonadota bacterium]|nr:MAG: hypothetical protein JSU87_08930 [Gemmatimonadota bacterium]